MLEFVLDFFYPPVCGFCNKINKNWICKNCNKKINSLIRANKIIYKNKYFEELIYLFDYNGIIRDKILDYKFNDKSYLYKTFSKIIIKNEKICGIIQKYDIIIPVPMNRKKLKLRGYNQVELIAKELVNSGVSIKLDTKSLIKQKNTIPQSTLSKIERKSNLIGAYKIDNNKNIIGKNILLFDDIFTTGSTVNECSRILKKNGAKKIGVLAIAKD